MLINREWRTPPALHILIGWKLMIAPFYHHKIYLTICSNTVMDFFPYVCVWVYQKNINAKWLALINEVCISWFITIPSYQREGNLQKEKIKVGRAPTLCQILCNTDYVFCVTWSLQNSWVRDMPVSTSQVRKITMKYYVICWKCVRDSSEI